MVRASSSARTTSSGGAALAPRLEDHHAPDVHVGALVRLLELEKRRVEGVQLLVHGSALRDAFTTPAASCIEDEALLGGRDQAPCSVDGVHVDRDRVDPGADEDLRVLGVNRRRLPADRRRKTELAGGGISSLR